MIKTTMVDRKTGKSLEVLDSGLLTSSENIPPHGKHQTVLPTSGFMVDFTGERSMKQNATVENPLDFFIEAHPEHDLYVKSLSWKLNSDDATIKGFGGQDPLDTGFELLFKEESIGEFSFVDGIVSAFSLIRACHGNPAFGTADSAFIIPDAVSFGDQKAIMAIMDLQAVFGLPYGLKLSAGSQDRIIFRSRDAVATTMGGKSSINCQYFGFYRLNK